MKKHGIYDAVMAGYTCVDLTVNFRNGDVATSLSDLLKPGKLLEIDGVDFSPGGLVANTGMTMKKFNKVVYLNGLIGNDFAGKLLHEWFDTHNLSEGIKSTDKTGTGISIVLAPPEIDRIFLESVGCNQIFEINHIDFDVVSQSRIFHFGYPPLLKQFYLNNGDLLASLLSEIHRMDVVTSLDFSLPDPESESGKINWTEIMKRVFPNVDIFTPSLEEMLCIMMPEKYYELKSESDDVEWIDRFPFDTIRQVGQQIIDLGVKILLIKAGHNGAYLITGNISSINENAVLDLSAKDWNYRELRCNAYHADDSRIKNACGAGDTATAAFLSAILNNEDPVSSLKYATVAGRNNLYCQNVFYELSGWSEMKKQINSEHNEIIDLKSGKNESAKNISIR